MLPEIRRWMDRRTSTAADWPAERLLATKAGRRISVVLPARDEESTVGEIVGRIRHDLVVGLPLVDELVVVDSRSADRTAEVAAAAGARVVTQDAVLPEHGVMAGKGEAMWKALAVTTGDLIVFVDADLSDFDTRFVTGLLGPLLCDPSVAYVKGCYDRPLVGGGVVHPSAGGRVTELVARPLINLHWPELAGFIQPLAGEYAGRRDVFERIPLVTGYGVELGLLIDLVDLVGLDALAQVDLGVRVHSHQSLDALGRMAGHLMLTAWSRLEREGRVVSTEGPGEQMTQFRRVPDGLASDVADIGVRERPPLVTIPEYAQRLRLAPQRGRA